MQIPIDTIFEFHKQRTDAHINTLNYYASLLGYHFPEHDNDKLTEPYRTGYAYRNYANHHTGTKMLPQHEELFWIAHDEHHRMAAHHIEHYENVQNISNTTLIEMICDWHSANFEEKNIRGHSKFNNVMEYFYADMAHHPWTDAQRTFIIDTINTLSHLTNEADVYKIWHKIQV